jgi:ABC-type Fe3+/spermidine/putrescine transport system ATPase subunit
MTSRTDGVEVVAQGVEHHYGSFHALRSVDLMVRPAEFMTLLGSSGSGKSTLLQAIAGLIEPAAGRIRIGGDDVTGLPPEKRDIGFVFQNYALFPHMSVRGNVAFPLQMRGTARRTLNERVGEALELVGLGHLGDRHPAELSGGQQQRVALARAITFRPRVLLLDEPLGALDRQLRQQLGLQLRHLQREIGITTIYVTHDQEEAFVLSSRIAVLREGRILQLDTPEHIYRSPADLFVATFLGDLNVLAGTVRDSDGGTVTVAAGGERIHAEAGPTGLSAGAVKVGFRPEELRVRALTRAGNDGAGFEALIDSAIFGGSWIRYELVLADGSRVHALNTSTHEVLAEGTKAWVTYDPHRTLVFPATDA